MLLTTAENGAEREPMMRPGGKEKGGDYLASLGNGLVLPPVDRFKIGSTNEKRGVGFEISWLLDRKRVSAWSHGWDACGSRLLRSFDVTIDPRCPCAVRGRKSECTHGAPGHFSHAGAAVVTIVMIEFNIVANSTMPHVYVVLYITCADCSMQTELGWGLANSF